MYFLKKIGSFFLVLSIVIGLVYLKPLDKVYALPPIATIDVTDTSLIIGETAIVTITFSEAVIGFTIEDLTVPSGTLSGLSSSDGGLTWTAILTPNTNVEEKNNVITLDNSGVATRGGEAGTGTTTSDPYDVDTVRPSVAITTSSPQIKINETITVTFTFSEAVSGFTIADLSVPNGTLSGLVLPSGGRLGTATFTPDMNTNDPSNVITLDNTRLTDLAGNTVVGTTDSNNFKIDTDRPTSSIEVDDTTLKVGEHATVTIKFSEAVTGFTNADLSVMSGTVGPLSTSDNITWTTTLTPNINVTEATNVITLDNASVADSAGNLGGGISTSNNYAVDTVRPTATITVTNPSLTAGMTSTVTFVFSEAIVGFTPADLNVANGTVSGLSSSDGGITWTATLTPHMNVTKATNVITLDYTGVMDLAGNAGLGTTESNNYAVNTAGPTATIAVADTSLAIGETTTVTFDFSEAVSGFTVADLTIDNGTLSDLSTSDGGVTWTGTLTPYMNVTDATNVITLDNSGVVNSAGNAGTGTTESNNYAIDTVRPAATIVVTDTILKISETSAVTFTFSEAVSGFTLEDLTAENGTLSDLSSSDGGITWTATFTPDMNVIEATNAITLDNTGVMDLAGNTGAGTTGSSNYTINTVRPTATIVIADTSLTIGETSLVTITFSEAVSDFTLADLTVPNGTLSGLSSSDGDITWTATLTPQANVSAAANVITLQNSGVYNSAGNAGQGTTESNSYSVRTVPATNGGGSSSGGSTAPVITPPAPNNSTVTETNGKITLPAGKSGVVSLGNDIKISIPAGASLQELKLTIEEVSDPEALLRNEEVLASPVFEILKNFPENFSKPVKLSLTFDPASLKSNQTVAVFYYDEVKKLWVEVKGGIVKENQITVDVDHFTKFAVLVVDNDTGVPVNDKPIKVDINISDISGHWAEASIKQAISDGIVTGYPDGTFKPGNTVTRAEFSVMLMNALNWQEPGTDLTFTDKAEIGTWAKQAVSQAVQAGIISGYENGSFRPNANITRAEMATMIAKALKLAAKENASTSFADDKEIPAWAKGSVASLKELGIVNGTGANEFHPSSQTTRAEAVIVLINMLDRTK
ncbi:S-layer homology domain-containing protein [Paenibacillus sp. Marseille-P2973]|uniref:Ig-like domain-containing protein n=1 Tax=Paenibacillus sp. Marseille-P2973 TaxID=1871032 RepID=UPI001B38FB27|nr:Ig-like domain-containing protein [Paenibacillus sp. Marseille-P2973]MBQ4901230.1 S-layer homology domain-containing protein [Paenibacillus sp. Marseille-P2973]